jgi:signal transduction histidine kinase
VWDLHPQYLDRTDLVSGLGRMAADLGENANVRIRIRGSGPTDALTPDVEKNVFRIAQEAVANAIRHGAAREITIEVCFDRDQVQIIVSDDGRGFDPAVASDGFGLTSMRERATQIDATLWVESAPGAGTRVTVTVRVAPLDRQSITARLRALAYAFGRAAALPKIASTIRSARSRAARR